MTPSTLPTPSDPVLPELRQELTIEPGATHTDGSRTWTLIDRLQHRYIQIDETGHYLLAHWRAGIPFKSLAEQSSNSLHRIVTAQDVAQFVKFCFDNHLTVEPASGNWRDLAAFNDARKHGWFMWAIHNYLFIKIPLLKPEPLLHRLLPFVAGIYTNTFAVVVALTGLSGLWFASRQWDAFWATFQYSYSWLGALTFAAALICVKSAHELGHALTAVRYGCRVPTMGVCLLVMFPVLYTDVSDAWRLPDRKKRLRIGAAGIAVELGLACFATFSWVFLPEGTLKSIAFSIATVGWVLSIAVNLNPLMRFDGYYLMTDWLGIDNLQARSFAFGRWKLRETLFALGDAKPEVVSPNVEKILICYAWAIWIYRLFLFVGIALLVYHFAFKVLGIILFLVEIIYFIAKPVASELTHWWHARQRIVRQRRARLTASAALAAIAAVCVPISTTVRIPAVLEASQWARIYPERAGVIRELNFIAGSQVIEGQILAKLEAPELDHSLRIVERKLALTRMRLARRISDGEDRATGLVLDKELQSLLSEANGLKEQIAALIIRAPFTGQLVEINPELSIGQTIPRNAPFGLMTAGTAAVIRGYAGAGDSLRLPKSSEGYFLPEGPVATRIPVRLETVAVSGTQALEIEELASVHGGAVAVRPQSTQQSRPQLIPVEPQYMVTLQPITFDINRPLSLRGVAVVSANAQSLAGATLKRIAAVLVRESGF